MFTERNLKDLSTVTDYRRGELLEETGGVYDFRIDRARGSRRQELQKLHAIVRGSERPYQTVDLFLDGETLSYYGARCDCAHFQQVSGLCEHCVAVGAHYFKNEQQYLKAMRRSAPAARPKAKPARRTEAGLSELLQRHGVKERMRLSRDATLGRVELEPTLHLESGDTFLTLRIGIDRMYVVKDIPALVQRIRDMEEYAYGKNLSFVHQEEAFDESSRALVTFLLRNISESGYWYSGSVRYFSLGAMQTDDLLEITKEDGILLVRGDEEEGRWFLTDEPLRAVLTLTGKDGGAELSCELEYRLQSRSCNYYFRDEEKRIYRERRTDPAGEEIEDYLYEHQGSRSGKAFVSGEDLPLFVRDLMPVLEKRYRVREKNIDLSLYQPEEAQFQIYLDLPQDNMITCDLVAVYRGGEQAGDPAGNTTSSGSGAAGNSRGNAAAPGSGQKGSSGRGGASGREAARGKAAGGPGGSGKSTSRVYHVFLGIPQTGSRNVPQEMEMQALVSEYCNAMDNERGLGVAADDEACMYRLLTEGIERFRETAEVYLSDRLRRIAEVQRPSVAVGVSLSGDLLNLTLSSEGMSMEELAAVLSKYDRRKKFIRLKGGAFLSTEDENLETLAQVRKGLMLTDRQLASGKVTVPKFRALFLDAQLQESEEISVRRSRDFKALIRQMHTVEDSDYEVPDSLSGILREYQKNGYRWLETLYANGFGGILADDMGLGKTLQVITFLAAHYGEGTGNAAAGEQGPGAGISSAGNGAALLPAAAGEPTPGAMQRDGRADAAGAEDREKPLRTLVVCPASLVYNWENECALFAPELPVLVVAGGAAERRVRILGLPERVIVITSYDLLKRDQELYEQISFDFQIIDEAQFIKNAGTKAAQSVKAVSAGFRVALTGTPVENRLSELWSIFDYLMPGYLYSYQKFRAEIELPIVQNNDEEALKRVQRLIAPFVLRRLKKDVLKDLPDKVERDVVARMEGEQKKLYEAHVQRLKIILDKQTPEEFDRSKIQILSELTKLRQLCCDPALLYEGYEGGSAKLDLCMELVSSAVESGHKLLVFSQFTTMLDRIAERLRSSGIAYYLLTGATPKQERMEMVGSFNRESDETQVFLISLKAGGTGLNLTAADIVIHYDPWWNTAAQNQATDRTHRIGQKNTVMVYRLIAKDTIEDNIVKLQERKQELADQVLGADSVSSPAFSREELMELLRSRQ